MMDREDFAIIAYIIICVYVVQELLNEASEERLQTAIESNGCATGEIKTSYTEIRDSYKYENL